MLNLPCPTLLPNAKGFDEMKYARITAQHLGARANGVERSVVVACAEIQQAVLG
jgi:hypothetical protein